MNTGSQTRTLQEALQSNPVIAAVKDPEAFAAALASDCEVVFLLSSNICTVESVVQAALDCGKLVYIHIDLMEGFGRDRHAVRYLCERVRPSGIITTHSQLVRVARELALPAIQRIFLIDNQSLQTGVQSVGQVKPDAIEVMPGVIPAVTRKICASVSIPVITGGLINQKEDIIASLGAGAVGVSTSKQALWAM